MSNPVLHTMSTTSETIYDSCRCASGQFGTSGLEKSLNNCTTVTRPGFNSASRSQTKTYQTENPTGTNSASSLTQPAIKSHWRGTPAHFHSRSEVASKNGKPLPVNTASWNAAECDHCQASDAEFTQLVVQHANNLEETERLTSAFRKLHNKVQ